MKAALKRLMLSARITEGYSRADLVELLGASATSVRRWERLGWLAFGCQGRAAEASVRRFLKMHPDQYQLSFVNEAWFKGLLFETYNSPSPGRREKNPAKTFVDIDANFAESAAENAREHFLINKEREFGAVAPNM